MAVTTRQELIDYCLRELGSPAIRINVTEAQIEDRVDEALERFREYHWDGQERVLLSVELTQEIMDNKTFDVPDLVYGITRVYPYGSSLATNNLFSLEYQLRIQDLYSLTSMDITNYVVSRSQLEMLDNLLIGEKRFRYNRITKKLYFDFNLAKTFSVGDFILLDCYVALDPDVYTELWSNAWLKSYVTALIKRQWGANLKKFGGMSLPGGVVVDGESIYSDAVSEIKELDDEVMGAKSAPLDWFVG